MNNNNTKIAFMGTPEFAVPSLKSLYNAGYSIDLVITQKDRPRGRGKKVKYTPIKESALKLGLDVYQPENINSEETIEKLIEINPDFIVVVAYGQILKQEILDIPKYGSYNVHASLLPKYRGAAPINWVLINGENETGVTIMEMEIGLDTGDIITSSSVKISKEDDTRVLHDKLSILGGGLIVKALRNIKEGKATRTPQDDKLSNYASMLDKEMGNIDWNLPGERIANLIRGLKPWPSAYTIYKDDMVKIHRASISQMEKLGESGKIIKVDPNGIYVNTLDSVLRIEELQFPGKRKLETGEYLKGNSIEEGIILGD